MRCHDRDGKDHKCDEAVLESMRLLHNDTKPCPRCTARIFKTQGCDHMFCTHCRTHFSWVTGRITAQSTNHHYDRTESFAKNLQTIGNQAVACESDMTLDAVTATQVPEEARKKPLFRLLYTELSHLRHMRASLFDPRKVMEAHDAALIQNRLNYLRGKLTEVQAKAKVYTLETALQKKLDTERLLSIVISGFNDLQRTWRAKNYGDIESLSTGLLQVAEESSLAIQKEYGGQRVVFRTAWHDPLPVFTLSS
jgi:hypothetical protein